MFSKTMKVSMIFALISIFSTVTVYAGVLGNIKGWITGELAQLFLAAVAAVLSVGLAILVRKYGVQKEKVQQTFKEFGEFLSAIAKATEDDKITKEELADIWKEGKEIFEVWK